MTTSLLLRVVATWLLFLPIPVINGALREKWYRAMVGDFWAQLIGVILLSVVFTLYAYFSLRNISLTDGERWTIGLIWLALTLAFEFGVGITEGRSWEYMLADYRVWEGRTWPLVLLTVLASPFVVKVLTK